MGLMMKPTNSFLSLLATVLLITSGLVFAQSNGEPTSYSTTPGNSACRFFDGFSDNGNGTVTDPRSNLIWKRCAEGLEWNGSQCIGNQKNFTWAEAMSAAKRSRFLNITWRLPSKEEFESIVGPNRENGAERCSGNPDRAFAASSMIANSLNSKGKPGNFWSFTRKNADQAYYAGFENGGVAYFDLIADFYHARFVSGGEASKNFDSAFAKKDQIHGAATKKYEKEKKASNERILEHEQDWQRKVTAACNKFYVGRVIDFKPEGVIYLNQKLTAVVLGSGDGMVSIKITDRAQYGTTLEVSCMSDQLFIKR